MGNVVLTGGGSLFTGFADRLANEMMRTFPHVNRLFLYSLSTTHTSFFDQTKIHAPGNPIERRYGGWLGGSILASLGTFHQLWISKEEWQVCPTFFLWPWDPPHSCFLSSFQEHGTAIVGQRCK